MATSLRSLAECIGLDRNGRISVLGDFFGFTRNRVPTDPDTSVTARVSLSQQFARLKGKHIHLNVIKVGFDTLSSTDEADALHKIDYAIYRIRDIYRSINLGVGRIKHFFIANADADGRADIGSEDEAEALWDEWTVPGNGIDVKLQRFWAPPQADVLCPVFCRVRFRGREESADGFQWLIPFTHRASVP